MRLAAGRNMRPLASVLLIAVLAGGCALEDPAVDGPSGKADGVDGDHEEPPGMVLATCFVRPGTDDFFDPDHLACRFAADLFAGSGTVNIHGEHACGVFSEGFFADEVPEDVVTIEALVVSDNNCPDVETVYPLTASVRFAGTPLTPPGMELEWTFEIASPEIADETEGTPLRALLPVMRWTVEIDNQLETTSFAQVSFDETTVELGDLRARPRSIDDPTTLDTVTVSYETMTFRSSAAGELQSVDLFVPVDTANPATATLRLGGDEPESVPVTGGGTFVIDDFGLAPAQQPPGN